MSTALLPQASRGAAEIDALFVALLLISVAVLALVFGLIWTYVIRYRAGHDLHRGSLPQKSWRFETTWTVATLLLFFGLFIWGADLYVRVNTPPPDAEKIWVVGKQWMWKVQHPGGQREIDALHVPVGRAVQLLMTSEDVIHDFAVPAFRIKHDVVPGRYESLWFIADRPGSYHLFCTQFCGTDHSLMVGEVDVLSAADYATWLAQTGAGETGAGETLVAEGRRLFTSHGCSGCHIGQSSVRAPHLEGVYGSPVPLADGSVAIADDKYIRDAILLPNSQVVAGFEAKMPSFQGQLDEEDLVKLVAYIRSLATAGRDGTQG
jgi:cytochrome c oxidase subunit II